MRRTTADPLADLLGRLPGAKPTGQGKWSARCPAHDDRNASLSVARGNDGRILLHCHAGCATETICAALGVRLADLYPAKTSGNGNGKHREALGPIVAIHPYRNSKNDLLCEKVRHSPKEFRWRRPDGNGGYISGRGGIDPPLYNLPAILNHRENNPDDRLLLVEGEKDADNLTKLGFVATTSPDGASKDTQRPKWRPEFTETLAGLRVAILCDNDPAGLAHGTNAAKELHGRAAEVRLIRALPGTGVKDVSDWIERGGNAEQLTQMIESAPAWTPEVKAPRFTFHTAAEFDALDLRKNYHVPGILAAGPVPTVLAGSFKTLKTSIAMDLAISVALGSAFLGNFNISKPCPVGFMSGESGGYALQLLARRIAHQKGWTMGAIGAQLQICTDIPNAGDPSDLSNIQRFMEQKGIGLIFLDPAYLMMRGMRSDDAGNLFAMAQCLDPLSRLGEKTGATICVIHHNSRGATRANAGEPAELSDIAWSGFAEWAGQWLLLSRRERFNPDSNGEHRLWLSAGGRDGHSNLVGVNITEGRSDDPGGMQWHVSVERASHVRQEAIVMVQEQREQDRRTRLEKQTEKDRQAIVAVMNKLPDGDTKTSIRDRTALRSNRFDPAFAELLSESVVEPCEISKGNNRKYEGYRLHRDAPGRNGTYNGSPSVASETDAPPIGGRPDAMRCSDELEQRENQKRPDAAAGHEEPSLIETEGEA